MAEAMYQTIASEAISCAPQSIGFLELLVTAFRLWQFHNYSSIITHCNQLCIYNSGNVESHMISDNIIIACEILPFQYCNYMIDCSMQWAIGTRNHETAVRINYTTLCYWPV